jgi:hypothetical protein
MIFELYSQGWMFEPVVGLNFENSIDTDQTSAIHFG